MREVSGAAIGDPSVRAAAMSAIDIWAPLGLQAEVCFAEDGLAAAAGRRLQPARAGLDGRLSARRRQDLRAAGPQRHGRAHAQAAANRRRHAHSQSDRDPQSLPDRR